MLPSLLVRGRKISTPALVDAIKIFNRIEGELKGGWQPQLPLEMALVEASLPHEVNVSAPVDENPQPASLRDEPQRTPEHLEKAKDVGEPEPKTVTRDTPEIPKTHGGAASEALPLQLVQRHWRSVLDNARMRDKSVQALLNSTQPGEADNQTVTLYVAHEFARGKLSQPRAKRLVEELLSEVLGQDCQVEFKVEVIPDAAVPGEAPEGQTSSGGAGGRESRDVLADDPLARAARQLGAEVRPIDEGSEK